jgi:ubiquitin carboxyl-terminal hydrolase 25/28
VHPAEFVFDKLNTKGEPYYLAYVKADEVQTLVSIPRRNPMAPPPQQGGEMAPPPVPPRPGSRARADPLSEMWHGTVMGDTAGDGGGVVTSVKPVEDVDGDGDVEMTPPPPGPPPPYVSP